jgi:hypothetical protein
MKTFYEYMQEQENMLTEDQIIRKALMKLGLPLMLAGSLMMTSVGCAPRPESIGDRATRQAAELINKADAQMKQANYAVQYTNLQDKANRLHAKAYPSPTKSGSELGQEIDNLGQ